MIEVHVAFPAVDERAGVEIFYATDAERVQVLGDWRSVIKGRTVCGTNQTMFSSPLTDHCSHLISGAD
ncbi:MAG TPA: hypothetical protein VGY75_11445 [Candidatus Udaeobacter sp.]|nr:hypothetical protein [Candidatus Udaeobacter sp.]